LILADAVSYVLLLQMVTFLFHPRGQSLFLFFFLLIIELTQVKGNFHVSLYPSRGSTQQKTDTDCHSRRYFISSTTGGSVLVLLFLSWCFQRMIYLLLLKLLSIQQKQS